MEENQEPNIKDLLKEIKEDLEEQKKSGKMKKFKMPFSARPSKGQVKKGWVTVVYVGQNKSIDFFKAHVDEGAYTDKNGIPHVATANYIHNYRGKPLIIQPEWRATPFNAQEDLDRAVESKNVVTGWKLLKNHFEKELIKPKGNFGAAGWIIGAVVVIGLLYYAYQQGYFS